MLQKTKKKKALKKAVKKVAKKAKKIAKIATKKVAKKVPAADISHSPGHRKMNRTDTFPTYSMKNKAQEATLNLTRGDIVRKRNSKNRRIVTGAAFGKTGRITIKE